MSKSHSAFSVVFQMRHEAANDLKPYVTCHVIQCRTFFTYPKLSKSTRIFTNTCPMEGMNFVNLLFCRLTQHNRANSDNVSPPPPSDPGPERPATLLGSLSAAAGSAGQRSER